MQARDRPSIRLAVQDDEDELLASLVLAFLGILGQQAFEHAGQFVPKILAFFEQAPETEAPSPNDPSELSRFTIPVLLLYGSESTTAHTDSIYYLDDQLPNSQILEITGIGHMAPELGSEAVTEAFLEFFDDQLSHDSQQFDARDDTIV